MKDFKVLKFLDKFKKLFISIGIDYDVMRKILQIKLVMDGRRVPTVLNNSKGKRDHSNDSNDRNNFIRSLWMYLLMGLIMIPFVIMKSSFIFQMSFVFGILIFMVMTSLISDFSSVLLDIRDTSIIGTKPVNSKTLNMAKTIHVLIYMLMLTAALTVPSLIASLAAQGFLFFILYVIEIILVDMFIVVLTVLLYMIILKFFDGEMLKDIINYVQIALSITLTIGYQLIGRLFDISKITSSVVFAPRWWQYFIVPMWFGAPFELIIRESNNIYFITFSILALIIPIVSIIIYIKLMATFENNLQKLSNNSEKGSRNKNYFINKLSIVFCHDLEERTFFKFTSYMIKNEREFKLSVYPSIGFAIIFPFIFIFNNLRGSSFSTIAKTKQYFNIYFCALMLPTAVMMLKYSPKYKAAWLYKALPVKKNSSIYKGSIKAFIIRLLVPVYMFEAVIFFMIFGLTIFPHLILVLLNMLLFTVLCFKAMNKSLPFSEMAGTANKDSGLIFIPLMMMLGGLVFIHYQCASTSYGVYIYMTVLVLFNLLLWKKAFDVSFKF
ncbi:MAG: rane protein [Clostridiaceae bacterium]|jgi:hypothetical protein|nr:rane protein [Clostridiaceae bacterium]